MTSLKHVLLIFVASFMTLFVGLPMATAVTVPESPPSAWNKGSFGLQSSSEYFFSHANYEETRGSFGALVNNNKWSSFENRFKARYGFSESLSLFAGTGANVSTATTGVLEKSNSAATEIFVGVDFLLARRWWRVVPEFEASYALDTPTRGQTTPLTSNGASYANAGVFFFKPYRYLRFEGYLGFHVPGQDLAKRFMYSLSTELAVFGAFTFGGGVQGYESMISDGTSAVERSNTQLAADATSARFYAYNPALLEARGWIGLRFDKAFGLRLGYSKTLNGVRTAEGQSLLLSLFYNSPGDSLKKSNRGESRIQVGNAPAATKSNDFRTEPETNDPEIFKPKDDTLDNTERLFDR